MIAYPLYLISITTSLILRKFYSNNQKVVNLLYINIFVSTLILSGFRFNIGYDYDNYVLRISEMPIYQTGKFYREFFSYILYELSYRFSEPQIFFLTNSIISTFFIFKGIQVYSKDKSLSAWIFILFPMFFLSSLSTVRVFTALSIVFFAFNYLFKKKHLKFFVFVAIATLFHNSAILAVLYIPLLKIRISKAKAIALLPISVLLSPILAKLIEILFPWYASYYLNSEVIYGNSGSKTILVLYLILFISILVKEKLDTTLSNFYFNSLLFSILVYSMLYKYGPISYRITLYFYFFIILLIPELLSIISGRFKALVNVSVCIAFVPMFMYMVIVGGVEYYPYQMHPYFIFPKWLFIYLLLMTLSVCVVYKSTFLKTVKLLVYLLSYYILSLVNFLVKKNSKLIFVSDYYGKGDNSLAFVNYVFEKHPQYTIVYYTKNLDITDDRFTNIDNSFIALFYQLRSKVIVFSYRGDKVPKFKSFHGQTIIDTMHGSPLKKIGYQVDNSIFTRLRRHQDTFDYILVASSQFKEVIRTSFNATEEQCLVTGFPRNDVLFQNDFDKSRKSLNQMNISLSVISKTILWVPTWRNVVNEDGGEDENFPILTKENISSFNQFLKDNSVMLVIKPHPFQFNLEMLTMQHSNIKVISNNELNVANINLYDLLNEVDSLITDYSSIYFDFLLKDMPIGFTIDDIDNYNKAQGFSFPSPEELMPGYKINSISDLMFFVNSVLMNQDEYREQRRKVREFSNAYCDGLSSERLAEFLKL